MRGQSISLFMPQATKSDYISTLFFHSRMILFSLHSLIILPWTQLFSFSSPTTSQRFHIAVLFEKQYFTMPQDQVRTAYLVNKIWLQFTSLLSYYRYVLSIKAIFSHSSNLPWVFIWMTLTILFFLPGMPASICLLDRFLIIFHYFPHSLFSIAHDQINYSPIKDFLVPSFTLPTMYLLHHSRHGHISVPLDYKLLSNNSYDSHLYFSST